MSIESAPLTGSWDDVRQWRKKTREVLIARRLSWEPRLRRERGRRACERLRQAIDARPCRVLAIYWPIRGEIDVRPLAAELAASGCTIAMPVIAAKFSPLEFWRWQPGMRMQPGHWGIPVPAECERVTPDTVLAPLVGFDAAGFRLGYGGGYFDRTLAAAQPRPRAIGIGYAETELPTICPQPHDIRMDAIVTEESLRLF